MAEKVYVTRDKTGAIIRVSEEYSEGMEPLDATAPELRSLLATTDLEMVRVLEDVIELLMAQGMFRFTDLPAAAQRKLLLRRKARDLLADEQSLLVEDEIL